MDRLFITRTHTSARGTFGVARWRGEDPSFLTLEDPWRDNLPNISCIPAGDYVAQKHNSPTFGMTFIVLDVPNRSHILFHKGNTHEDTQGCILVGEKFDPVGGVDGIAASGEAWGEFWAHAEAMEGMKFRLSIGWAGHAPPVVPVAT
jgi:hypothetical protein|tara:strand:+ start:51944 stop:52384 length:441 start_codon:yes stop_codon:yes gene_type:complete